MINEHFERIVREKFGFDFSPTQQAAMQSFLTFLFDRHPESLFLLKGYAGTGKTSLVAAIVNTLLQFEQQVVLLAPTGRAAKVFAGYSHQPAFTIHKKIYRQKNAQEGIGIFSLGFNGNANTLFFVDEASMISMGSQDSNFGSGSLLDDLIEFVYNGRNNRLVLIGDTAQLPPIGVDVSPALEAEFLRVSYGMEIYEANLTDIMRQSEQSGILYNATRVREMIGAGPLAKLLLRVTGFPDIVRVSGGELLEELDQCYNSFGMDETMVICRSNKRANRFNEGIRARILYREEAFGGGDKIMVVKNNYFWGAEYDKIDFIANGDIATVEKVGKYKDLYGLHFVHARLSIYGYEEEISAWVMLDTLTSEQPALSYDEYRKLFAAVEEDYMDIPSKQKRYKKIQEDEYFNALQIKFAYAVTCHKAQGGQWDAVFIDPGWMGDEMMDDEYWRWLYTAFTRARKKLYLINFKDVLFGDSEME